MDRGNHPSLAKKKLLYAEFHEKVIVMIKIFSLAGFSFGQGNGVSNSRFQPDPNLDKSRLMKSH